MSDLTKTQCRDCIFFNPISLDGVVGECQRHPPSVFYTPDVSEKEFIFCSAYPEVGSEKYGCGDGQARVDKSSKEHA